MRSACMLLVMVVVCMGAHGSDLPPLLSQTGFSEGDLLSFSPQYPLWSDGTRKRRWISLPAGSWIDAGNPDDWKFPAGTRLFKEFSYGRAIETRVIQRRADGSWDYGVYVWRQDGSDADLAPASGIRGLPVPAAPAGRYDIPSRMDCLACHEGGRVPVLGFATLQLSHARDPLAPHADADNALDLNELVRRGLLRNLPGHLLTSPPQIAARTPLERAALGYLHGNCGHCHGSSDESVPVDLNLVQPVSGSGSADALRTLINAPSRFRAGPELTSVVVPGQPHAGVLMLRLRSREPRLQMPPIGTRAPDSEGLALIGRWIESLDSHELQHTEKMP